jgi:dTDP-4-amino-4,6-dideoxygalactose transaminase
MKPIYVTKPSLPPLEELYPYLDKIWESRVLTNGGQFHRELEKQLCEFLGVKYISLFTNATIALITSLKSLNLSSGGGVKLLLRHFLLWQLHTPYFGMI